MRLVPVTEADAALYRAMFCSAAHMADLGGPQSEEQALGTLTRQATIMASDRGWVFKLVPDEDDWRGTSPPNSTEGDQDLRWQDGVGTVCLWTGSYKDIPVTEIGWGVAPKFCGHGFGAAGVALVLEKARKAGGRWGVVHAFTSVSNVSSNALARKAGFVWVEECDIDYDETIFRAHHYEYDTTIALL